VLRGLLIIHSPLVGIGKPPVLVGVTLAGTVDPVRVVALMIALISAPIIEAAVALANRSSAHLVLVGKAPVRGVALRRP
jgi:hypothetical protein